MSGSKFIAVGVLCILYAAAISCQESGDGPTLTIEPFRLTTEVGNDAVFTCTYSQENNLTQISWFYPDYVTQVEPESNSTRIYVDSELRLHIRNMQENDTGLYMCKATFDGPISSTVPPITVTGLPVSSSTEGHVTSATTHSSNETSTGNVADHQQVEAGIPEAMNVTVALTVYVMPTYFTEGMIILGINLGLLLVFLICLAQSLVSERKRLQTYFKK